MSILVGLDVGTTTLAGVVWDENQRAVLRHARRRNTAAVSSASACRAAQDPHRLRALTMEVLADLTADGPHAEPAAVGAARVAAGTLASASRRA